MKSKRGVYLDIYESDYYYDLDGIRYYFSSQLYLNKFKDNVINYVNENSIKLKLRYKINLNFDLFFTLSYYKKVEKRGFRVVDISTEKTISKDIIILNTIVK